MSPKIIVIAHNVRSSHNIGSLFRTCDGIGVEKIFLSGYTPYPAQEDDSRLPHLARKIDLQINKTALGAQHNQKWQKVEDIKMEIKNLRNKGYLICGLEQSSDSIPINHFKAPEKIVLIIGNEVSGIESNILKKTDKILEIPMFGQKESYNVIQALAMALYSFRFGAK